MINPVLLNKSGIQISVYGIICVVGLGIAWWLLSRENERSELLLSLEERCDLFILVICGSLIGARIFYVGLNLSYYFGERIPWYECLKLWQGGYSAFGGLLGGLLAGWIWCIITELQVGKVLDLLALPLFLGQSLVMLGSFINGETFGLPTRLPWGIIFHYGPAAKAYPGIPLHPVMLYQAILYLAFFALIFSLRHMRFKPGFIASLYFLSYSLIRFFTSFFQVDVPKIYHFHAAHIFSIICFISAFTFVVSLDLYIPVPKQKYRKYHARSYKRKVPSKKYRKKTKLPFWQT